MENIILSNEEFETLKQSETAFALYITEGTCNVGENLAPKLEKMFEENFPKIKMFFVYNNMNPEIAAQLGVFVVPAILIYFEGRLYIQKNRNISIYELEPEIDKLYKLVFE